KRPRLPEINDDFAKDMLYESLEALKTDVRERLAASKEQEARRALSQQAEEKLLAMVTFELPEGLKTRMTERTINRQRMDLAYRGVPRDEIEQAADQISQGAADRTERDMRMYFVLQQIAEDEDITVSESEIERRIQLLAQLRGLRPGKLRDDLRREGRLEILRSEIRDEKVIDFLIDHAKVVEADAGKSTKPAAKQDDAADDAEKKDE
ncbi:MAG TPA: hypothetical protein VMY39_02405, partial [Planctomycetota bacterium]|nr:hypothetical protein [Planctomycetota bacterium]